MNPSTSSGCNPVIKLLLDTPPANLRGLEIVAALLDEANRPPLTVLMAMQPDIAKAEKELDELAKRSRQGVMRCYEAKAAPAPAVPVGF